MLKKYNQAMDGRIFYNYLKIHRMSIIQSSYRVYFTTMCRYKLVSAGITPLEKLQYPSNERFVKMLNEVLATDKINAAPTNVAYSQDELRNRITETLSSVPLERTPLRAPDTTGSFGKAKWIR